MKEDGVISTYIMALGLGFRIVVDGIGFIQSMIQTLLTVTYVTASATNAVVWKTVQLPFKSAETFATNLYQRTINND